MTSLILGGNHYVKRGIKHVLNIMSNTVRITRNKQIPSLWIDVAFLADLHDLVRYFPYSTLTDH